MKILIVRPLTLISVMLSCCCMNNANSSQVYPFDMSLKALAPHIHRLIDQTDNFYEKVDACNSLIKRIASDATLPDADKHALGNQVLDKLTALLEGKLTSLLEMMQRQGRNACDVDGPLNQETTRVCQLLRSLRARRELHSSPGQKKWVQIGIPIAVASMVVATVTTLYLRQNSSQERQLASDVSSGRSTDLTGNPTYQDQPGHLSNDGSASDLDSNSDGVDSDTDGLKVADLVEMLVDKDLHENERKHTRIAPPPPLSFIADPLVDGNVNLVRTNSDSGSDDQSIDLEQEGNWQSDPFTDSDDEGDLKKREEVLPSYSRTDQGSTSDQPNSLQYQQGDEDGQRDSSGSDGDIWDSIFPADAGDSHRKRNPAVYSNEKDRDPERARAHDGDAVTEQKEPHDVGTLPRIFVTEHGMSNEGETTLVESSSDNEDRNSRVNTIREGAVAGLQKHLAVGTTGDVAGDDAESVSDPAPELGSPDRFEALVERAAAEITEKRVRQPEAGNGGDVANNDTSAAEMLWSVSSTLELESQLPTVEISEDLKRKFESVRNALNSKQVDHNIEALLNLAVTKIEARCGYNRLTKNLTTGLARARGRLQEHVQDGRAGDVIAQAGMLCGFALSADFSLEGLPDELDKFTAEIANLS